MEAFERFDHAGFVCELHMDEEPVSPADWDTLGTLVGFSGLARGWSFPEREATGQEEEAFERGGFRLVARYLRLTSGAIAVPFDFHDYGSSGTRLRSTSEDDRDADGFLVTTPARVVELASEEQARDPEWITRALVGELREWGAWAAQEVVGYVVRDREGTVIGSCWGFYPERFTAAEREQHGRPASDDGYEYVRQEARDAAEAEDEARAIAAEVERVERERAARQDIATVTS